MKVRGFQVAPAELEGHLILHPFVVDACVVGIPDAYSGELPYAYVVLAAEADAKVKADASGAESKRVQTEIMKVIYS